MLSRLAAFGFRILNAVFDPLVAALARAAITPNQVTIVGSGVALIACPLILNGQIVAAGWVYGLACFSDLIDGRLARITDRSSDFGAFLDSTLDRITDGAVYAALAVFLAQNDQTWLAGAALAALMGSFLTSYTRARAEALGVRADVGLFERPHRIVLLCAGLAFGVLPAALVVLATATWITTGQRVHFVWRQLDARTDPS